jgi:hypothetical protein
MSSVRRVLLTIALGAALGAGPAIAAPAMAKHNNNGNNNNSTRLAAILTDRGLNNGDDDGFGAVNLTVRSNGRVCYTYFIQRVENAHDLAIYRGNNKITLANFGSIGQGCRKVSWQTAWALRNWPSQFTVRVEGSDGPIRGRVFRNGGGNNNW